MFVIFTEEWRKQEKDVGDQFDQGAKEFLTHF